MTGRSDRIKTLRAISELRAVQLERARRRVACLAEERRVHELKQARCVDKIAERHQAWKVHREGASIDPAQAAGWRSEFDALDRQVCELGDTVQVADAQCREEHRNWQASLAHWEAVGSLLRAAIREQERAADESQLSEVADSILVNGRRT